ncbi:hypothetical protein J6590_060679 [Homalodisca vitripennis]|nr:hypothetical protein J6590_060679 [Homalodisca vitripennis]
MRAGSGSARRGTASSIDQAGCAGRPSHCAVSQHGRQPNRPSRRHFADITHLTSHIAYGNTINSIVEGSGSEDEPRLNSRLTQSRSRSTASMGRR